jgi:MoxR-like ATPase
VEGETRPLPKPFFVIATQNPSHQIGTFPLPESQLDRFLMRLELGYPDSRAERELLSGTDRRDLLARLQPQLDGDALIRMQSEVQAVHASAALLDYVQALVRHTRSSPDFAHGLSPRAALALLQAGRAWAYMADRDHVLPEDLQAVMSAVVGHRLAPGQSTDGHGRSESLVEKLLIDVAIP